MTQNYLLECTKLRCNLDLNENKVASMALIMKVRENYEGYTKKQVEGAFKQ